jgi:HlyD family secretion protein
MSRRGVLIAGIVAAAAIAGAVFWWLNAPEVEAVRVSRQTVRAFVADEGKTRLATTYTVDMPINGTLARIELEVGDRVEAGQVIARLDPLEIAQEIQRVRAQIAQQKAQIQGVDVTKPKETDIAAARARVEQSAEARAAARAQLEIARVNAEQARTEFQRMQRLLAQRAVSQARFDEAERNYRALQGEVERAEVGLNGAEAAHRAAALELESLLASVDDNEYMRSVHRAGIEALEAQLVALEDRLNKTEVRAPVTGIVIEKPIESERVLAAGTPILVLGRLGDVEVEADILSEEIGRVEVGQPVEITGLALGNRTLAGEVKRIYPAGFKKISALGIEQQRVKVIVAFDNTEMNLRPGVSVDVRIVTASAENVLAVPDRSVFREEGKWYVLAVRGSRIARVPVTLGLRNDQWAEIREGLEEGEFIVVDPSNNHEPGARVEAVEVAG